MEYANIHSLFSSIQGEGLFVGYPQIFIRFSGCNLRCRYCDTPEALRPQPSARIEQTPFSGQFKSVRNPVDIDYLTTQIRRLVKHFPYFHSVSVTGGEPLLQSEFLAKWLPRIKSILHPPSAVAGRLLRRTGSRSFSLRPAWRDYGGVGTTKDEKKGLCVFLETNGTLPHELSKVIKWIDIVSMDIKTSATTGVSIDWGNPRQFLELTVRKKVYAKVLIGQRIDPKELRRIRQMICSANKPIPVVLQPISTRRKQKNTTASMQTLTQAYEIMKQGLEDVRIIPQMHKMIGWS